MRWLAAAFIGSCALAATAPAHAERSENREYRELLYRYATCLVNHSPGPIRAFLVSDSNGLAFRRWRIQLKGECMLDSFHTSYINPDDMILRLALADVLLQRNSPARTASFAAVRPLLQPAEPPKNTTGELAQQQVWFAWISRVGECVVRANPTASANALLTKPYSKQESASLRVLAGTLESCGVSGEGIPEDMELRGTLALNYLRLSAAAAAPGGSGQRK